MAKKSRPRLGSEKVKKYITEGDPRVSAIMAGAVVNEVLQVAIEYNLISLSKDDREALFENSGPLSTFAAQIRMGYAMGLYGKKLRDDLNVIRKMRNDFAHTLDEIVLSQPEFRNKIASLNASKGTKNGEVLSEGDLLYAAVSQICLFLILRTAPSSLRADDALGDSLRALDFSNFSEVKRRDVTIT
jgi:DNA-binding MltR family transcriptional regulator